MEGRTRGVSRRVGAYHRSLGGLACFTPDARAPLPQHWPVILGQLKVGGVQVDEKPRSWLVRMGPVAQLQNRPKPFRCQPITVAALTMETRDSQPFQTEESHA
jgi:hypothetical protein